VTDRPPITVNASAAPDRTAILAPVGDIGYHEAPALRQAIRDTFDAKPPRVLIDLAGVNYMATPGLATLVEALQISKRSSVPLVLCSLTERVRAVFEIARLQSVFKIAADRAAALSS
jgi:anti-sigma B factor antagonist